MRRSERGQVLAETGMVITLLIIITLGIIEFGWVFFALHMVTNAARDGARAASALLNRGTCGDFTDTSSIAPLVTNRLTGIANVDGSGAGGCCQAGVCVQQCDAAADGTLSNCAVADPGPGCRRYPTGDPIPVVKVTVAGHISDIFGLLGNRLYPFCRAVTFRDQGRIEAP